MDFSSFEPIFFGVAFLLSSLAGVGCMLRSPQTINLRNCLSTILNSGTLGLIVALLLYDHQRNNLFLLLGGCGLAGIGGVAFVELVSRVLQVVFVKYFEKRFNLPEEQTGKNGCPTMPNRPGGSDESSKPTQGPP
jgi:hypothetical protein